MGPPLKIISLNVNGIRNFLKCQNILLWLVTLNFDVVFLQETHFSSSFDCNSISQLWEGSSFFSFGSNYSCGTAILVQKNLASAILSSSSDINGRWVRVSLEINDSPIQLLNVYAPNTISARADFFSSLTGIIKGGVSTILGGDFNCVEDSFLDKIGGDQHVGASDLRELNALNQLFNLVDIYRCKNPSAQGFTWSNKTVSCRLDKFYVSKDIAENCSSASITCFPFSDHDGPTIICSPVSSVARGPGVWKFNTNLLRNAEFVEKIRQFLCHWHSRREDFVDHLDAWWDICKKKMKHICIHYSKHSARQRRQERAALQLKIQRLSLQPSAKSELETARKDLEKLDLVQISGARIRAKERFHSEYEKSSKYFFALENKRQSNKVIQSLRRHDGSFANSTYAILQEITSFYTDLYKDEPVDIESQNFLLESINRTLPEAAKDSLESPLSNEECFDALKGMKQCKSPGSDGFPSEFYVFFWPEIGGDLIDVLHFCFERGLLSSSMREAILTMIFKKGDRLELKNWRPISLLNVDYKIATKALTSRLKNVLHHIIHPDQTSSVPDRSIFESLLIIRDSLSYIKQKGIPLALIKIDQEKAFDRVNWSFMFNVLHKMNFGPSFISFVTTLYSDVFCRANNNGHLSQRIPLHRGVRQGCPLSPLLFSIIAECLGNIVRQNSRIDGLYLPGCPTPLKIIQYADDTTLFVKNEFSVKEALKTVSIYEKGSGSKVNFSPGKSQGRWFGNVNYYVDSDLQWTTGDIEILGIFFGSPEAERLSWDKRLVKLNNRLEHGHLAVYPFEAK